MHDARKFPLRRGGCSCWRGVCVSAEEIAWTRAGRSVMAAMEAARGRRQGREADATV